MQFPATPTVHAIDPVFKISGAIGWREPRDGEPFRTCSYCGSIHPGDLLTAIAAGAKVGGSDWKYSWPHKFYVDVVNPDPTRLFDNGSEWKDGKKVSTTMGTRATLFAKWYNEHIQDEGFDDEARAALLAAIELHAGIRFEIKDGKLKYCAPHPGYQR